MDSLESWAAHRPVWLLQALLLLSVVLRALWAVALLAAVVKILWIL